MCNLIHVNLILPMIVLKYWWSEEHVQVRHVHVYICELPVGHACCRLTFTLFKQMCTILKSPFIFSQFLLEFVNKNSFCSLEDCTSGTSTSGLMFAVSTTRCSANYCSCHVYFKYHDNWT